MSVGHNAASTESRKALHAERAHHHAHPGAPHGARGNRRRLLIAAILTCGMMIAEVAGGLLAGSLALIADAGHMLTDAVALVLAYVAQRVSERPGNRRMTYGFDRLQILIAYTNGLTVVLIALWIVVEAVDRLLAPTPVLGGAMFLIAILGLAVNGVAFLILNGGDRASLNLRGAILHVVGDLLGSLAAIGAALIILTTGWTAADPLLSVVVAVLLLRSAWTLIRDSGLILLEGTPPHINRNDVANDLVGNVAGIADVHHMHVWSLDGRRLMATLHVRLAAGADAEASIAAIKARLGEEHGIGHATVEIETGAACPDGHEARRKHGTAGG
jgi:cobalt-zinc-cadmium efflux system protein